MEPLTQIAASDLALFAKAQDQMKEAQATLRFVSEHIGTTYQLTQADQVDLKTGVITRAEAPQDAPLSPEPLPPALG